MYACGASVTDCKSLHCIVSETSSTYSACMSEKVRANRLNIALSSGRELANGLEVFLARPALWEGRQRQFSVYCSHRRVLNVALT